MKIKWNISISHWVLGCLVLGGSSLLPPFIYPLILSLFLSLSFPPSPNLLTFFCNEETFSNDLLLLVLLPMLMSSVSISKLSGSSVVWKFFWIDNSFLRGILAPAVAIILFFHLVNTAFTNFTEYVTDYIKDFQFSVKLLFISGHIYFKISVLYYKKCSTVGPY